MALPMYQHTQRSSALLLLLLTAALVPFGILASNGAVGIIPLGVRLTLIVVSVIMIVSALTFTSLTITVRDGQLSWWFGRGIVKKTVPLGDVASAVPTTTSLLNGVGIHLTSRGWLYNVEGHNAVYVTLRSGRTFLLGTDEPSSLAHAIMTAAQRAR